jgi:hypothetical protein
MLNINIVLILSGDKPYIFNFFIINTKSPDQTLDQDFIAKKTCNFLKKHLEYKITSLPIVLVSARQLL